ncbi:hypothetical protein OG579_15030 [Williamsia herbipolensis]|uniref:Uncharacterized protein n=1 Tax=Williamsia herbipolensis TaxID=1603258 RepID=A0AAU4JYY0_9NOCA|nr:hypothetical protein [Williamsia herbipolensis]
MSTLDPDVLQAQYFIVEFERACDVLVVQTDKLESLKNSQVATRRRRGGLYDLRRQIAAMRARFADQI